MKHMFNTSTTKDIMDKTPITLEGVILNRLKLSRKYHSGTISKGVDNPFDLYIISNG